ncbi:MAG: ABC transporter ATP-binding protein [Anaerolineaceae bacterium]|nr:ABC transporter ATP-binding protein [Anaerolineaceae bacterium]
MANVAYRHVFKKFGDVIALNDFNIEIDDKEFLVLVGPSGCGKTTALRSLAGLEEVSSGEVIIDEKVVNDLPAKDRDIAMVFQSYALYPHMTVYDNMAFGLKLRKMPKDEIQRRVMEAAETLGIEKLMKRKPRELSGGQNQRVALGRAIVREPKVFLLDEPLSNLDAKLRVQMRSEISKLHHRLQTTFVYVTHDQGEAMTMATRIAVLNHGILQQLDTPQNLYDRPDNLFVAGFIGSPAMNFFNSVIQKEGDDLYIVCGDIKLLVPEEKKKLLAPLTNREIVFGIRPEDVHNPEFAPPSIKAAPVKARVDVSELMGNEINLHLVSGSTIFVGRVDPRTRFQIADEVEVVFNMNNFHVFDPSQNPENPVAVR